MNLHEFVLNTSIWCILALILSELHHLIGKYSLFHGIAHYMVQNPLLWQYAHCLMEFESTQAYRREFVFTITATCKLYFYKHL